MLEPELRETLSYSYGNRLRGYFAQGDGGTDALKSVVEGFRADPETRHGYVSLWDTSADLPEATAPCHALRPWLSALTGRLTLAATYRSHNLLTAGLRTSTA